MIPRPARNRPTRNGLGLLLLGLALTGCLRVAGEQSALPSSPEPSRPIDLRVALYMDETFRAYIYRERNFELPVGELLRQQAPTVLETVFTGIVTVTDPAQLAAGGRTYQAVLRPHIRFSTYHPFFRDGRMLLEPQGRMRIYSEWTLSDPAGRTIWSQEVVGQAEGDAKSRARFETGVKAAMADLLGKLRSALTTSSQIAGYVREHRQP